MCEFGANLLQVNAPAGVVTDAQVSLPNGGTERKRARACTTSVLISVNAERLGDQERLAKKLAQRILIVHRPDRLPYLVALAVRAIIGTMGIGRK